MDLRDSLLLGYAPLQAIDWLDRDGSKCRYLVDGLSFALDANQCSVAADGVFLGQIGQYQPPPTPSDPNPDPIEYIDPPHDQVVGTSGRLRFFGSLNTLPYQAGQTIGTGSISGRLRFRGGLEGIESSGVGSIAGRLKFSGALAGAGSTPTPIGTGSIAGRLKFSGALAGSPPIGNGSIAGRLRFFGAFAGSGGAGGSLHPDTIAYQARLVAAGGTISAETLAILDTEFVRPIITAGYKDDAVSILPMLGSNLVAASIPLWGVDDWTLYNFVSGDFSEAIGLRSDGSSKHARLILSDTSLASSDAAFMVYGAGFSRTPSGSSTLIGSFISPNQRQAIGTYLGFLYTNFGNWDVVGAASTDDPPNPSLLTGSSVGNTDTRLFYNSTQKDYSTNSRTTTDHTIFTLFALLNTGATGDFAQFDARFVGIWRGLTPTKIAFISDRVTALQAALGRA